MARHPPRCRRRTQRRDEPVPTPRVAVLVFELALLSTGSRRPRSPVASRTQAASAMDRPRVPPRMLRPRDAASGPGPRPASTPTGRASRAAEAALRLSRAPVFRAVEHGTAFPAGNDLFRLREVASRSVAKTLRSGLRRHLPRWVAWLIRVSGVAAMPARVVDQGRKGITRVAAMNIHAEPPVPPRTLSSRRCIWTN